MTIQEAIKVMEETMWCFEGTQIGEAAEVILEALDEKAYPTKADRIRAMSDEELAKEILETSVVCHYCANRLTCEGPENYAICLDGVLAWLREPAEVEK